MNNLMTDILNYSIQNNEIGLWWLGQSGFIIKTPNGKITVIDAYLTNSAVKIRPDLERQTPVPIQPEELVCDYYICTHNHIDHFDPETIERLQNIDSITFIGPRNVVKAFQQLKTPIDNAILLEAGETIQFGDITFTGTFCIPNKDAVLDSIGIIFQCNGKTIYHTGDTGYHPFLEYIEKFNITVALMCINGKLGNLTMRVQHVGMREYEIALFKASFAPELERSFLDRHGKGREGGWGLVCLWTGVQTR